MLQPQGSPSGRLELLPPCLLAGCAVPECLAPRSPQSCQKRVPKHALGVCVDEVQPLPVAVLALSGVAVDSVRQSWVGACAQQDPVTRKGCARPWCRYPARAHGSEPAISLSQTEQGFRSKKSLVGWSQKMPRACTDLSSGIFLKTWPIELFRTGKSPWMGRCVLEGFKYLEFPAHRRLLKCHWRPFLMKKYRTGIQPTKVLLITCVSATHQPGL